MQPFSASRAKAVYPAFPASAETPCSYPTVHLAVEMGQAEIVVAEEPAESKAARLEAALPEVSPHQLEILSTFEPQQSAYPRQTEWKR